MDYRRAGLSRQPEQCRRRLVRPSRSWLQQLLRSRAELLRSGPDLRRSRALLPHCRPELLRPGCSGLLRSGRSGLLRPGPDLLPGSVLLRSLQQLLQGQEMQEELVQRLQGLQAGWQEEPMLPDELLHVGSDLLCTGCSQLLRSGCADLRRSGRFLLPLVINASNLV